MAGMFCSCGDLILGKRRIEHKDKILFYCERCKTYYDGKENTYSQQEYETLFTKLRDSETIVVASSTLNNEDVFSGKEEIKRTTDNIYYVLIYHPKDYARTDRQKEFTVKIWNFKDMYPEVIETFYFMVKKRLNHSKNFVICVMPSSKEGIQSSGIRILAKQLCANNSNWEEGLDCIYRKYPVKKKHEGGPRNIEEELPSLEIRNANIIKDKTILLLDDVTTTGTSLLTGEKLLLITGAKKVVKMAIALASY